MNDEPSADPRPGPILLCAGTEPASAARLAETAACLLADRPVVVLAIWHSPPLHSRLDATLDALSDIHAESRGAACHAATETARAAHDVLDAHGLDVTTQVFPNEQAPWGSILKLADELDAGAIVAGTAERLAAWTGSLGRQARALAHRTRRPLLLLPIDPSATGTRAPAVFAYDGSTPAGHAVRVAAGLLRARPAVVATVWHNVASVVNVAALAVPDEVVRRGAHALDDAARHAADRDADEGAAILSASGWQCEGVALQTTENVAAAIIAEADDEDAAIVVTGTRGRSRVVAALLGSNAEAILRHARRPVLLVPPADAE